MNTNNAPAAGAPTSSAPRAENRNANIECRYCREMGHYAGECPKRPGSGHSAPRPVATATFSNQNTGSETQTIGNYFGPRPSSAVDSGQPPSTNALAAPNDRNANMFQLTRASHRVGSAIELPRWTTVPFLSTGTKIRISVKFTSAYREVEFLIDSGATLSVINGRALQTYTVFYPKAKMTMLGISPHDEIPTLGLTFGCLQLNGIDFPHEFQVVDDRVRMTTDGLLGCDFLLRYGALMDFGKSNLTLCTPFQVLQNHEADRTEPAPRAHTHSLPNIDITEPDPSPETEVEEILVQTTTCPQPEEILVQTVTAPTPMITDNAVAHIASAEPSASYVTNSDQWLPAFSEQTIEILVQMDGEFHVPRTEIKPGVISAGHSKKWPRLLDSLEHYVRSDLFDTR